MQVFSLGHRYLPVYCLIAKGYADKIEDNYNEFDEVESFGNADRGGFGSTGTK